MCKLAPAECPLMHKILLYWPLFSDPVVYAVMFWEHAALVYLQVGGCCSPAAGEGTKSVSGRACSDWRLAWAADVRAPSPSAILTMLGAAGRCCSGALQALKPGINSLKTISARHAALNSSK